MAAAKGSRPKVTAVPELAELWDSAANGDVDPATVSVGSPSLRYWVCSVADDHRWSASVSAIFQATLRGGRGCPFCRGFRASLTNRLDVHYPEVAAQWHRTRNGSTTPSDVVATTHTKYWWKCPAGPDHVWEYPVQLRTERGHGCPFCSNRRFSVTNSVAAKHPKWLYLWHPTRNPLPADQTIANTEQQAWWKCPEGPDHEWDEAPGRIAANSWARGNTGCPCCKGIQPSVTNSVASVPRLLTDWHPTANGCGPDQVVAGTAKRVWWLCATCGHEWQATGSNRLKGDGCPMCQTYARSTLEICLAHELHTVLPDLDLSRDKVVVDGQVLHVDLLLESQRVVVELDGRYFHDGRDEQDTGKGDRLRGAGWHVIRVREEPLELTHPDDVRVPDDAPVKVVADAVIRRLRDLGHLGADVADAYLTEQEPRRLAEAIGEVRRLRPGKRVRLPGTPKGPSRVDRWERRYELLCDFVARERHAGVPAEHVEDGVELGAWVGVQRSRQRRGGLDADRAARLRVLPGWSWDPVADEWEDGFAHLLAFLGRERHLNVPTHHIEADGYPLGSWVRSHRRRGGGRRTMTAAQRRRLTAVPGWTFATPLETQWDRTCTALEAFAAREGHCRAARDHEEDGVRLEVWCTQQRARYRRGELPEDRAARLAAIPGWSWQPAEDAWDAGYAALQTFAAREGHGRAPKDHREGGYPLGAWVGEQRNRRHDISAERRARLEAIPGWSFDTHADSWERHFAALEAFVGREGHAGVPTGHVEDGLPLGSWVIRHRLEYKNGLVPADRAAPLSALPGWMWDTREARWRDNITALRAFVDREGHAAVPSAHREGDVKLGAWVVALRARRKQGDLSAERQAELEALPGWVWDARDAVWDEGFNSLVRFRARTGHLRVPRDHVEGGYRLGQWVSVQRSWRAAGKLRADRSQRLMALPGWTWGDGPGALTLF